MCFKAAQRAVKKKVQIERKTCLSAGSDGRKGVPAQFPLGVCDIQGGSEDFSAAGGGVGILEASQKVGKMGKKENFSLSFADL